MKEIGELLKTTREKNGVTVEEAASDLSFKVSQINSIENGELRAFKDVCNLKFFVKDYAKYLGLDSDDILDTFNEFIFDYTSRIPIEEIEKSKKKKTRETKKVASPYTTSKKRKIDSLALIYIVVLLIVLIGGYLLINYFSQMNVKNENVIKVGAEIYEFSE